MAQRQGADFQGAPGQLLLPAKRAKPWFIHIAENQTVNDRVWGQTGTAAHGSNLGKRTIQATHGYVRFQGFRTETGLSAYDNIADVSKIVKAG